MKTLCRRGSPRILSPRLRADPHPSTATQKGDDEHKHSMTGTDGGGEHYSNYSWQVRELCALLLTIVYPAAPRRGASASVSMSPAAAASMLLGASVALMLCGSVTFAIGFFLMPWVAGLALLFGFAGAVNALSSGLFLCTNTKQPPAAAAAAVPCKHPRGTDHRAPDHNPSDALRRARRLALLPPGRRP